MSTTTVTAEDHARAIAQGLVEQQKTEHAAQKKENAEALLHTRMQKFIAAVRKDLGEGKYFCPCCGTLMQSGQAKKDRMTSSCPNCMAVLTLYAR